MNRLNIERRALILKCLVDGNSMLATSRDLEGVYVIWCGDGGACIRVGQGNIQDRIAAHREDQEIQEYSDKNLLVTWAALNYQYHDGVEAYLADQLDPIVGERFPNVQRIPVNLPS